MSEHFTKKISLIVLFLFACQVAWAQQLVKGRITGTNGEALAGVAVSIKGTQKATVSNPSGDFSIAANNGDILDFTYVGMTPKSVQVTSANLGNVVLEEDVKNLNEVVVIGYGTVRKRDLTGSVASVSAEQLKDAGSVSFGDQLRGKLSGVQVTSSGGEPGAGLDIRIRGLNSISASSNPLYVIDGVPIESNQAEVKTGGTPLNDPVVNPLSYIDPNTIASIEVLKDASAAAIYGSRGANGVILITTKTGAIGKGEVNFNTSFGSSVFNNRIEMLGASEYATYIHTRYPDNALYTDIATGAAIPYGDDQTIDWQDVIYTSAPLQNTNISFSNNTDKTKFYTSVGYGDTKGVIPGSDFKRLSLVLNGDTKISKKFSLQLKSTSGLSNRQGQLYGTGQGSSAGITYRILSSRPLNPNAADANDPDFSNLFKFIDLSEKLNKSFTNVSNLTLTYNLAKGLNLKVLGGGYLTSAKNTTFLSKEVTLSSNANGLASLGSANTFNWLNENTLNYSTAIKKHTINALAGFTQQRNTVESYFLQATNFPIEINGANSIQDALSINSYGSDKTEWSLRSYLGRINYSYNDRYLFTASLRVDGSSKFYGKNKYSYFPAAALSWQVAEEPFVQKLKVFDQLKLRLSYGQIGNQSIPAYSALSKAGTVSYFSGTTEYKGASTASVANVDLKWETSETYNTGIDMAFFNNRISVTADAYVKNTKNLLLRAPVAGSSGFNSIFQNVGKIRNKGFELVLSTRNIASKDFSWNTDLNFNVNRNTVLALGTQSQILTGDLINSTVAPNVIQPGYSLGSFYGYIQDGLYQPDDFEANGTTLKADVPRYNSPRAGYLKFKDISGPAGLPDGIINAYDRTVIGNSNPKHFGGIRNTFGYKNVSLSTFFSWQVGNQLINWNRYILSGVGNNNLLADYYHEMWTPTNTNTTTPVYLDIAGRNESSTMYVKDASFLRFQNLTLNYSLPQQLTRRMKMAALGVFFSADNIVLFTNYEGYDPEITSTNPNNFGVDYFSYPRPKTYTFGLNARF
ncbi:MAG: TonB-linked outer membrane protein SusC/RagA family [Sphingobacteriaceae bacterium]|jgi:TonB-linked SusC/RagA family outer membrane protein|nr:TonB-linked outer membrane protein SusC/RagA family [Sphingobacteriaceae bacterium]